MAGRAACTARFRVVDRMDSLSASPMKYLPLMARKLIDSQVSGDIVDNMAESAKKSLSQADRAILAVLQQHGRISNVELAQLSHTSESNCLRRTRALERSGVITGYRAGRRTAKAGARDIRLRPGQRRSAIGNRHPGLLRGIGAGAPRDRMRRGHWPIRLAVEGRCPGYGRSRRVDDGGHSQFSKRQGHRLLRRDEGDQAAISTATGAATAMT